MAKVKKVQAAKCQRPAGTGEKGQAVLDQLQRAFAGFSEEEMAVLSGFDMKPSRPRAKRAPTALPSPARFRSKIKVAGKPMSRTAIARRRRERA